MSNIADKPGVYKDFSGRIRWKDTFCEVRGATFEILVKPKRFKGRIDIWIEFESGTVTSGRLFAAFIDYGNFQGAHLHESVFRDGVFDGGSFFSSFWLGGVWKSGKWGYGFDKFGRTRSVPPTEWGDLVLQTSGIADEPGRYEGFSGYIKWHDTNLMVADAVFELGKIKSSWETALFFHSGTVLDGKAYNTMFDYCVWKNGICTCDSNLGSIWQDGIWEKGHWYGGRFLGGTWKDGSWHKGIFNGGTWLGGTWTNVGWSWYGGFDKYGTWHKADDSPDKWNI